MASGIYSDQDIAKRVRSAKDQRAEGKAARQEHPFAELAEFHAVDRDPVEILAAQNAQRLPDLIGLRRERMAVSPFTFYRGSARLMSHDLAQQADTGRQAVICGDAHISNFGLFASPERRLVFDLNDFDEAAPGPWEWDVRRMVTSVVLGAQESGFSADVVEHLALQAAQAYRLSIRQLSRKPAIERYYASIDDESIENLLHKSSIHAFRRVVEKARTRTSIQAVRKMTEPDEHGVPRFVEQPPVLTHVHGEVADALRLLAEEYLESVRPDLRLLTRKYRLVDGARRVVGVGSVGTRCYTLLLLDAIGSPLVLQVKEAVRSVVTEFNHANKTTPTTLRGDEHNGRRVVDHQRILQAVSDPFLGWASANGRDYYIRQFRDMKGSIDLSRLSPRTFEEYVVACGLLLGRAHAQSPTVHWIAGYLGKRDKFDRAITAWSLAYAEQAERDFARFAEAADWN